MVDSLVAQGEQGLGTPDPRHTSFAAGISVMKHSRCTRASLALFLAGLVGNAQATPVVVDFDALDASAGFVSGAALDGYLAGFGITLSNVVGSSGPFVADATTAGGGFGFPNFFTLPSSPNYLWHQVDNAPIAYQLDFATEVQDLSFVRPQTNAFLSPSGHLVAPWSARALDGGGNTLQIVGAPVSASPSRSGPVATEATSGAFAEVPADQSA